MSETIKSNGDGIGSSPPDAGGTTNDKISGVDSGGGESNSTADGSNKHENDSIIAEKRKDGSPSAKVDDGTSTSQPKDDGVAPDGISSNPKVSSSDDHAYDLPTDDEGGENNTSETSEGNTSNPKISMSPSNKEKDKEDDTSEIDLLASSSDKEDDDSDIELLDADAIRAEQQKQQQQAAASKPAAAAKSNNDNDDSDEELEIMGTTNEQKFPHNRKECLDYRYNANSTSSTTGDNPNAKFCSLCYCYVCDKKASECENWYLGEKGICTEITADNEESNNDGGGKVKSNSTENATAPHNNHCNAQDKGDQKYLWQNMRNAVKNGRDPSKVTNSYMPEPATLPDPLQQYMANYSTSHGAGHRNHATSRGGARQRHSHGGGAAATAPSTTGGGTYGSTTYAAARSRSAPPPPRRRRREGSSGTKRPAQADHRARIRTQQMLEDLYG